MNFSQIVEDWIKDPMSNYLAEETSQGAFLALLEMTLAITGTILNLVVLIPIINSSLINSTLNVLIANLCLANLVSAVFVKLIGVIYHGYAVAAASWKIDITFCTIYTVTSRATWAVFPYTIVAVCSLGLLKRASNIFIVRPTSIVEDDENIGTDLELQESKPPSPVSKTFDDGSKDVEDWEEDGKLTAIQKTLLGFIWMSSLVYSMISDVILTKERDVKCSVRSDLKIKFNMVSIIVVIAIPLFFICLWPIAHIILTLCSCIKGLIAANRQSHGKNQQLSQRKKSSNGWPEIIIVFFFSIIFLTVYPTSMYVTEMYYANIQTIFTFMLLKYCVGSLQLIISPLCLLLIKSDIRKAVKVSYTKGSTQNDEAEVTYEELQAHLGIGVQVSN